MLRTNQAFLTYAEALYAEQQHPGNVTLKHFSRGQKLFSQKEPASKVMLIKEGITKCYFNEENDKDYILEFLGKGEIIGEIECIRRIPSLCNVEAMTEVQALAFSIPYFRDLLGKDLKLNSLLLDAFAERIVNTASRASFQQLYTVEHSLGKLMEFQSRQEINLSKEDMAAYLGITIRTLNRSLKNIAV